MKLPLYSIPKSNVNPGDRKETSSEKMLSEVSFHVHKFNNRPKPDDKRKIIFIPAFSEFSCETLLPLYAIPHLLNGKYKGYYTIVIGWYGRDFLYKHLVDEYWELKEEFQHLREYCRAIHHHSKNLKSFENELKKTGTFITATDLGWIFSYPKLLSCIKAKCNGRVAQFEDYQRCQNCGCMFSPVGIFNKAKQAKKNAHWLPKSNSDRLNWAKKYLPPNAVGIFARGRKCYGRNLTPEFYSNLIDLIQKLGFNPVWMGEKSTILPCPNPDILDFSTHINARDLEYTFAITSLMKFTIQFWTASTRLAGLVGTPFILFESPDQIWGPTGQEGVRLYLATRGEAKLVISNYSTAAEQPDKLLQAAEEAIVDVKNQDFTTLLRLIESEIVIRDMIRKTKYDVDWS